MTDIEKKIIDLFNNFAKEELGADEELLVPVEIDDTMCEIPTFPFEGIMSNEDDPLVQNYEGPEVLTYIQLSEGREIYSGAYCLGNFTDEQKNTITEFAARLEEIGIELDTEDTDEGFLMEVGILFDSEEEDWEERLLSNIESGEDSIEDIFDALIYEPCYQMIYIAMTVTDILNGDLTIDQAVAKMQA